MTRLIELFISPSVLVALLMGIGLFWLTRGRYKAARNAIILALSLYYVLSTWPVSNALIKVLEDEGLSFAVQANNAEVEAIVILAGSASVPGTSGRVAELSSSSWNRLWQGIKVFHSLDKKAPIIYSGGTVYKSDIIEANIVLQVMRGLGVPEEFLLFENGSRNTYESAVEVKKILDLRFPGNPRHRVALVTSAWHLSRADRVFKKLGIDTVPWPCDYHCVNHFSMRLLIPDSGAFSISQAAFHELVGLLFYRLLGRI